MMTLTVWQYEAITLHQCAFTPSSSMLDAFDRVVETLVPFFLLCPVLDGCLDDMGKCWLHVFSLLFENALEHWKIILDAVIGWSLLLTYLFTLFY
jgi:hypothetical protein